MLADLSATANSLSGPVHELRDRSTRTSIGNEQYNPLFAEQVAAMEARATKLGLGKQFFYANPGNGRWLHPDDAAKVEALGLKDHATMSQHVGAGGAVNQAQGIFQACVVAPQAKQHLTYINPHIT
jgi:hypothetical protein|eukprot:COSAG06_NODE_4389_length_4308_cov_118.224519_4_plen_126_part_00